MAQKIVFSVFTLFCQVSQPVCIYQLWW